VAIRPREATVDGGLSVEQTNPALPATAVFVAGRQQPAARRSHKRPRRAEGPISHLERSHGLRRNS